MRKYEEICEYINNRGELLTTKDEFDIEKDKQNKFNSDVKLKIRCICGNKFYKSFAEFKNSPHCQECGRKSMQEKQRTPFVDIKKCFEKEGYQVITEEKDYKNNRTKLHYICPSGHEGKIDVHSFMRGVRCKTCAGLKMTKENTMPYENIKSYIEGENGNRCKLISFKNEYQNTKTKLEIQCKCGNTFKTDFINFKHENKKQCNECGLELRSKENSPNWRGGTSSERDIIKNSDEYKNWRSSVFKRDNYTCQCCGDNKGGNLEAHHIENFSEYEELRFDINNGITLCKKCHNPNQKGSFHHTYGTHNNTKEQLNKYIKNYNN